MTGKIGGVENLKFWEQVEKEKKGIRTTKKGKRV